MSYEKRIEVVTLKACELKDTFGNPRKITKQKLEELKQSFEQNGDFGIFIINEENQILGGNQRHAVLMKMNPETPVLCKRLIGYSVAEQRRVNIMDNTHQGEWDLSGLADWTKDLGIDLGVDLSKVSPDEMPIGEMELIHYEKYDYVLIACRYETDYNNLIRKLGIEGKKVKIAKTRKIKARAVWYEDIKEQIIDKSEVKKDGE